MVGQPAKVGRGLRSIAINIAPAIINAFDAFSIIFSPLNFIYFIFSNISY